MSDPHLISITVNGVRHETVVEARRGEDHFRVAISMPAEVVE